MKVRDKKRPKETESDDLAEMRAAWGDDNDEDGDGASDKLVEGKNLRNILPAKDPDGRFYQMFGMHYGMGPNGDDRFMCTEPGGPFGHNKNLDKKRNYKAVRCEACKVYCKNKNKARAIPFGSPEGKKFWGDSVAPWRARYQYLMATSRPNSKDPDERTKVFILQCGQQIAKPLIETYYDSDGGLRFTNPKAGNVIKIIKRKLSQKATDIEYDVRVLPVTKKIRNWKLLKAALPDLKSFLPTTLDAEAQRAIIDGDGSEDGDERRSSKKNKKHRRDDDDVDLDEVEDDDEGGEERKLKLARRKKRRDEEVDPDAPEDSDEKPRKKKKGKKSKMRDKLKKKARKSEDD